MDASGREDMRFDCPDQWHQRRRGSSHPIGQRRDIEIDALSLVDRALSVQRQVQAVFGEQHSGEERGPGTPLQWDATGPAAG